MSVSGFTLDRALADVTIVGPHRSIQLASKSYDRFLAALD
jgi:uncharacterized protein (DUF1778 family)